MREVRWRERFTPEERRPGVLSLARRRHELRGEPAEVAFGGGTLPLGTAAALAEAVRSVVGDVEVVVDYLPQDGGASTFTLPLSSLPLMTIPNLSGLACLETPRWLAATDGSWGWAMGPDSFAAYLAAPEAVADAVLATPALEADEVTRDDPVEQVWLGAEPDDL